MGYEWLFTRLAMVQVEETQITPAGVTFTVASRQPSACCPSCQSASFRVHSRYERTVSDLPVHGRRVRLQLKVRRFFCDQSTCEQQTFAERFEGVAEPHARKTRRLVEILSAVGFACGGEGGSRLAGRLGMRVSGDTMLHLLHRAPLPPTPEPTALGLDDWAWRRGHRYGTLLCDLDRHAPVDLLAERSAESLSGWLAGHPGVRVISRDRASCYAEGCTQGAPQATQVADRFHLLENLREALARALDRHVGDVTAAARIAAGELSAPGVDAPGAVPDAPTEPDDGPSAAATPAHERRLERYRQVLALHHEGLSLHEIARRLGLDRGAVRRIVQAGQFTERARRPYARRTDRFEAFLRQRWAEGCHNAQQLYREVRVQGYAGSSCAVRRCVARWREEPAPTRRHTAASKPQPSVARPSTKRVSWMLWHEPADRDAEDQRLVEALCQRCPDVQRATDLTHAFARMVRERKAPELDGWIARTREAGVPRELTAFAEGLLQDEAAVRAALSLPWSNGQLEGQVNRLKLIKRMMYGRGGFELLRQRVLHRA